jgi:hypothetical protein
MHPEGPVFYDDLPVQIIPARQSVLHQVINLVMPGECDQGLAIRVASLGKQISGGLVERDDVLLAVHEDDRIQGGLDEKLGAKKTDLPFIGFALRGAHLGQLGPYSRPVTVDYP